MERRFFTSSGFSLLELLIVIVLIGIIGVIVSQVFVITIRSQAKSEVIKEMKQSGDHAVSVIESMVRNASDIVESSCNTNAQSFAIINPDGYSTTFDCSDGVSVASVAAQRLNLTSSRAVVTSCTFRVVCPAVATSPKYVYFSFTLSQIGGTGVPNEQRSSESFQSTVSLRSTR